MCGQLKRFKDIDKPELPVSIQKYLKTICKKTWMNLKYDAQVVYTYAFTDLKNVSHRFSDVNELSTGEI